jgi:hypothetical protein
MLLANLGMFGQTLATDIPVFYNCIWAIIGFLLLAWAVYFPYFTRALVTDRQPWPADLPLFVETTAEDGTESEELDMGVVFYSCSFAVIFIMILSQATLTITRATVWSATESVLWGIVKFFS